MFSLSIQMFSIVAFLFQTNLWTHHHALSLDGSAFLNFLKILIDGCDLYRIKNIVKTIN